MNGAQWVFDLVNNVTGPARAIQAQIASVDDTLRQADKSVLSFSSSLGTALSGALAGLSLGYIGKQIYDTGVEMEQTRTAYNVLIGDVKKSEQVFKDLKRFADLSSLTDQEVFGAGKSLLAVVDTDDVANRVRQLSDLAMGNAEVFSRLTSNYAQIRAIGKAGLQDVRQFGNAGIDIFGELTKLTGKEGDALAEFISNGGVTAKVIEQIFDQLTSKGGKFFGMTEQMAQTVGGKMSTIMGGISSLYDKIFVGLMPLISTFQNFALAVLPVVEDALREVYHAGQAVLSWLKENSDIIEALGVGLGVVAGAYAVYVGYQKAVVFWETLKYMWMMRSVIAEGLLATAQGALNAVMAANPIAVVIGLIAALAAIIYYAYQNVDWFRAGLQGAWAAAKSVFKGIYDVAKLWIGSVVNLWKGLGEIMLGVIMLPSDNGAMFQQGLADLKSSWDSGAEIASVAASMGDNAAAAFKGAYDSSMAESAGQANGSASVVNASNATKDLTKTDDTTKPKPDPTAPAGSGGSGSGDVRNVTVNNKFEISIHAANIREAAGEIRDIIQEYIVSGVRDSELIINGPSGRH